MKAWSDRRNSFKDKLTVGIPASCMWMNVPWLPMLEVMGDAGLDAVIIDQEHASYGLGKTEMMIATAAANGVVPVVRTPGVDPGFVYRVLDAGAYGIVFPRVSDGDEAETARRCLHYAPEGTRGWGGGHTRWARYASGTIAEARRDSLPDGVLTAYSEKYFTSTEDCLLNIMIIETQQGVSNVSDILDRGQPDLVIFGWGDFSVEVGLDARKAEQAARRVHEECRKRSIGVALTTDAADEYYPGCFYLLGNASLIASRAISSSVSRFRQSAAGQPRQA